jgi:hypothetical protein
VTAKEKVDPLADGRVRVGRFEWERLLMMSDVPETDRFRVLAIGIFMSEDGGSARPGGAGLALFGPHEETWKQLLRRTVKAGWLALMKRGGARRGRGGTTVRHASVYAATVPLETWLRREEILGSLPYRRPSAEGSAEEALKEAAGDFLQEAEPPREAASQPSPESDLPKEATGDFLQRESASETQAPNEALGSFLQGLPDGALKALKEALEGFEGSPQGLPHHVVPTSRTSSSVPADAHVTGGGGGQQDKHHAAAVALVADLDYLGQWPDSTERQKLTTAVRAALGAGWTEQDLRRQLDLKSGRDIDSATAVYLARLRPGKLPTPPTSTDRQRPSGMPPWCGKCNRGEEPQFVSQRLIDLDDGTQQKCHCHPGYTPDQI